MGSKAVRIIYSPRYQIDIGLHVFPTQKYRLVHDRLIETGVASASDFVEPEAAPWEDLALVHTSEYLERIRHGAMTPDGIAQLELPWSQEMVDGFRVMVGGTILAAQIAVASRSTDRRHDGDRNGFAAGSSVAPSGRETTDSGGVAPDFSPAIACHIGGGLHHAFPNHGEGFCPFNDVAVAVRVLQRDGAIERAAIVDLDVHHGNGTAFVFESDPSVFTFSMHQQHNYPMWKPRGALDIGLPDGARDATFLDALEKALPKVFESTPDCVFYLAGADPYEDDQLGGLRLTKEGLRRRDRLVIAAASAAGVPLVVVLAGGYARHVEDTVEIHVVTVEEAVAAGIG